MKKNPDLSPELESELRQLFADDEGERTSPAREQLEALVLGELDEAEEHRLLEQVALDPELTDELLELRRLAAGDELSDEEAVARQGVDAVMASIAATSARDSAAGEEPREEPDEEPAPMLAFPPRPTANRPGWIALAAAALVALASLVIAFQAWRTNDELRRQVAKLEAGAVPQDVTAQDVTAQDVTAQDVTPREVSAQDVIAENPSAGGVHTGVHLVDLFADSRLRGDADVSTLHASEGEPSVLILTPGDPEPGRAYDVTIRRGDDELWSGQATAEASGAVVLLLEAELLEPGALRLELHPNGGDASIFELHVEREP